MTVENTASAMLPVEITLIVAATRNMGIGRAGGLPWTGLKKEMAYFARVTKRLPSGHGEDPQPSLKNAVIMGRKTWDSIPEKFRPLKGRLNVVLSRAHPPSESLETVASTSNPVRLPSLQSALYSSKNKDIGRLFVIGGAEIYKAALQERAAKRILLTRILSDFECDTFFPVQLGEDETGKWRKTSKEDLDLWVGEKVPEGIQDEHGVQYVFEMYERE